MNKVESIRLYSKNFGKLIVYPDLKCSFGNLYFVTATKQEKTLSGVVDSNGIEVINMQNMELEEIFNTSDKFNYCLGFKHDDTSYLEYYHIKLIDNKYKLVAKTLPYDPIPLQVRQIPNEDNYWMFEARKDNKIEYSIYDINKANLITNFFDEVIVLKDNEVNNHKIYFRKDITVSLPNGNITGTSAVNGFLDKDGFISSKIFATELGENGLGVLYDQRHFGDHTLEESYNSGLNLVKKELLKRLKAKDELEMEVIKKIYDDANKSLVDVKTKIINFKPRKNV